MKRIKKLFKASAFSLGCMHVINKIIESNSIINSVTRTSGKYYHWKNGDVFYKVYGEGKPPILFIHDLTAGSSNYEWLELAKQLSDTYTVYCPDLIGCGKSDKPAITYTTYFYVQLLQDFVKEVIKEKPKVAATGFSSAIVLMANRINKDLFDEIMLVNPLDLTEYKKSPDDLSRFICRIFDLPVIGKTAYYIATNKMNTEYYLTEKCIFNTFHMDPSITKAYYDASHYGNGNGKYLLGSLYGKYLSCDITKALETAENRIVIVTGEQNKNGKDIVKKYQKLNQHIIWEFVSESKMLPQLENPGEMLELLYLF